MAEEREPDPVEAGKSWTHVGEYSAETDCGNVMHTGDYLRRRELLAGVSPDRFYARRRRRRRRVRSLLERKWRCEPAHPDELGESG